MAAVVPLTAAAVADIEAARRLSLEGGTRALAAALGLGIHSDGGRPWMHARDEVLLELFSDALEAGRDAGLPAGKLATFIEIHQRLAAALLAGVAGGAMTASAPMLGGDASSSRSPAPPVAAPMLPGGSAGGFPTPATLPSPAASAAAAAATGSRSTSPSLPALGHSVTAQGALQSSASRLGGPAIGTSVEAAAMFEALMRTHAATSFSDPEAATSRFTLPELAALAAYVRDRGFLKHFLLYRHAFAAPERHRTEQRSVVVEAPLPPPPLAAGHMVPT